MKALSRFADLLDYPTAGLPGRLSECAQGVCSEHVQVSQLLNRFRADYERLGLERLQEIYTGIFDLKPDSSLYTGYHLFGDNWDRSTFLARLQQSYREQNFSAGAELPDHACTMLRFISVRGSTAEARDLMDYCLAPALAKILSRMDPANPYAAVIEGLLLWIRANYTKDKRE